MKYLKLFENFGDIDKLNESWFKKPFIKRKCEKYGIKNYTINVDGSIDVDGNVHLYQRGLTKLPLKFNNVSGNFYCYYNKLTTLEGGPQSVGGHFDCNRNKILTFEGAPNHVGSYFYCNDNPIENIWNLFQDYSKVELLNDLDPIRGNDILMDRFNTFLSMIGKDEVESVDGYNCINLN